MRYNYTVSGRLYSFSRPIPSSFYFEEYIDHQKNLGWMKTHWYYSIYFAVIYLVVIYTIQLYMKSRPPLKVQRWMAAWNAMLAFGSIFLTIRCLTFLGAALAELEFYFWICDGILFQNVPCVTFYGWFFIYSKVLELGDTIFIVLNKGNLMFLHCYHHAATLVLAWYLASRTVSFGPLMGYTNVVVHSLMYSYFAFKALGCKIPRAIAITITILQTSQMGFGVFITAWAYWAIRSGKACDSPPDALEFAFCIYFSYAVLFCHLFYKSYLKGRRARCDKKNV